MEMEMEMERSDGQKCFERKKQAETENVFENGLKKMMTMNEEMTELGDGGLGRMTVLRGCYKAEEDSDEEEEALGTVN